MSGSGKVVCVTGASGYIATWLVKLLLHRGYTVRATVRNLNDPKKTQHLYALEGANERLHMFKADLLEDGSFDAVVDGCDGVFHTASPFIIRVTDPQAELIDPAVKGTLNILGACAKTKSVRRVVLTSSIAAMVYNNKPKTPDVVVDETWFSDSGFCRDTQAWYMLSKTLSEKSAWEFVRKNAIDMVTVNPGMVLGPLLQQSLNTSAAIILDLANGIPTFPNKSFGWVHVRDVADAHILAFEDASASGRYCLVERVSHVSDIVKILRDLFPHYRLPENMSHQQFSTVRATYNSSFGGCYIILEEMGII